MSGQQRQGLQRYDSKNSGDNNVYPNSTDLLSSTNGSERTFSRSFEEENAQLKRRIAQLEAENEKLKLSVFLLSERYSKGRDAKDTRFRMDVLQAADQSVPPFVPSPSSAAASLPPYPQPRRHSGEVFLLHRNSKDLSDAFATRLNRDMYDDDSEDGQASISSTEPTACRTTLTGHKSAVYACKFSGDGAYMASTSLDRSVRLWNVSGGTNVVIGQHSASGTDLVWDGSRVISSSMDKTVMIWDSVKVNAEAALHKFPTNGVVHSIALCDANTIVAGTSSGYIQMFDIRQPSSTEAAASQQLDSAVYAICFAEASYIFSGDAKGTLRAWDTRITRSEELYVVEGNKAISGIAYGGKSYLAVNSYDNALRIFCRDSSDSIKLTHTLRGHKSKGWPIRSCFSQLTATSPSLMVATGSSTNSCFLFGMLPYKSPSGEDALPQVSLLQHLQGHLGSVYATDFSVDNHLATCSEDGTIKVWWRRL